MSDRESDTDQTIPIVVNHVRGKARVAFKGIEALEMSDDITREESEWASTQYDLPEIEDGTQIGHIEHDDGEYVDTDWYNVKW